MAQHHRQARYCANTEMPEGLTAELTNRVLNLRDSVKTLYLKEQFLSKFVSKDTDAPQLRRSRAIDKWLLTERDNEATNDRLFITPEEYQILPRVSFKQFVDHCRAEIEKIIGVTAPVEALIGSFSGGASTSRPRTKSHPASKYLGKVHVTSRCLELFEDIISEEIPGWTLDGNFDPVIVPGNVMFTVPKKTDIDRVACKEPDLNMFVQKGIGTYFRRCLRRIGINLNDQSINRSLAREGSITNRLVTYDLSSASDSVTTELVALLLPECWYTLLDSVRSPVTNINGDEHRNHMFSSMGNGFTFELESLLFYALTRTICFFQGARGVVSIYGDDIICPSGITNVLPFVFAYFGFTVNSEKSHIDGPFRESCGGHYHDGFDITPFYVKRPIEKLTDVIHVANQIRKWAWGGVSTVLEPDIEDIWLWLKSYVPSHLWGGWDTNSIFQLVSYDEPRNVLQAMQNKKSTGLGGYYHWLNATWDRAGIGEAVKTSRSSETAPRCRLRPARVLTVPQLPALFLSEFG